MNVRAETLHNFDRVGQMTSTSPSRRTSDGIRTFMTSNEQWIVAEGESASFAHQMASTAVTRQMALYSITR